MSVEPVTLARPLEIHELVDFELRLVERVEDLLRGMRDLAVVEAARQERSGRRWDVWAQPDERASHRVLLIDGERGTGKTSIMLTLLEAWKRDRAVAGDDEAAMKGVARPLPPLDFDPLPPEMPLLGWIVQAFKPLVDALEPAAEASFMDAPVFTDPLPDDVDPILPLYWRLFSAAVAGWGGGELAGAVARDADEWILDRNQQSEQWHGLTRAWRAFMDTLIERLEGAIDDAGEPVLPPGALLVLPIDDADLQVTRNRELLLAVRLLRHRRLAYLLTGHVEHFEEIAIADYYGRQRAIVGAGVSESELKGLTPPHEFLHWPRRMGKALVQKTIPRAHRFEMRTLGAKDLVELGTNPGWETLADHFQHIELSPRASALLEVLTSGPETQSAGQTFTLLDWVRRVPREAPSLAGFRAVEHLRSAPPGEGSLEEVLRALDRLAARGGVEIVRGGGAGRSVRRDPLTVRARVDRSIPWWKTPLLRAANRFEWLTAGEDASEEAGSDGALLLDWNFAVDDLEVLGPSLEVESPLATVLRVDDQEVELPWPWIRPECPALADLALKRWAKTASGSGVESVLVAWLRVQLLLLGAPREVGLELPDIFRAVGELLSELEAEDPARAGVLRRYFGVDVWMLAEPCFGLPRELSARLVEGLESLDGMGGASEAREAAVERFLAETAERTGVSVGRLWVEPMAEPQLPAGPPESPEIPEEEGEPLWWIRTFGDADWLVRPVVDELSTARLLGFGDGPPVEAGEAEDTWATHAIGRLLLRDPEVLFFGRDLDPQAYDGPIALWQALLASASRSDPRFRPNTYLERVRYQDGLQLSLPRSFIAEPVSRDQFVVAAGTQLFTFRQWVDWTVVGLQPRGAAIRDALLACLLVAAGAKPDPGRPVVRRSRSLSFAGVRQRHVLLKINGEPIPMPPLRRWGSFELLRRAWLKSAEHFQSVEAGRLSPGFNPLNAFVDLSVALLRDGPIPESRIRSQTKPIGANQLVGDSVELLRYLSDDEAGQWAEWMMRVAHQLYDRWSK